jgi:hypothetical protein
MHAGFLMTSLRILTMCCVNLLLSLLPAQQMVRTGLPGRVEHFVTYSGSAAVAIPGYGASSGIMQMSRGFWVYAAILDIPSGFGMRTEPRDAASRSQLR